MSDLPDRFAELGKVLNEEHVERSGDIQAVLWALVSGTTLFLLGEPGIAKSMLARRTALRISGGRFFDADLDKFSTPETLFGPRSLEALKDNRWERETAGTLIDADWGFIDEFFEGSSALLKTLLRSLRERTYRNGTEIVSMPLTTVIAASNDVPTDGPLMPLYDRLVIRRKVGRVVGNDSFLEMLSLRHDPAPAPLLTWGDVLEAQAQAREVVVPEMVLVAMNEIRRGLAEISILPSDRRFVESLKVIRAAAWLDGGTVEPIHLRCLADICWAHPDQRPAVSRVIEDVIEPMVSEIDRLISDAVGIGQEVNPGLEKADRERQAIQLHDRIRRIEKHRNELVAQANPKNKAVQTKIRKLDRAIHSTSGKIMRDLFGMDPAQVAKALKDAKS